MAETSQTRQALGIFKRALSIEPAERESFLGTARTNDAEQRSVVEAMSRADDADQAGHERGDDAFLAETYQLIESAVDLAARIPDQIGQYTIIRRIGAGGMGIVYEAEQESPRRRVALEVSSSGWKDGDRRRRLEREIDLVEPDNALKELAEADERSASIVEMRFLAGMTIEEVAASLDVSETTVKADWRAARAWLKGRLTG